MSVCGGTPHQALGRPSPRPHPPALRPRRNVRPLRRVLAMEVRTADNERSLGEARRTCERQEQRAELAERAARGLELQVVDADR